LDNYGFLTTTKSTFTSKEQINPNPALILIFEAIYSQDPIQNLKNRYSQDLVQLFATVTPPCVSCMKTFINRVSAKTISGLNVEKLGSQSCFVSYVLSNPVGVTPSDHNQV